MKHISALLIGLTILILPRLSSPTAAQNDSTAPYIYYYSDLLNAFIIERADGTDSRTLGHGLIPEDTNTIAGPGWSPSGEWLAWTAAWIGGYGETHRGYKPAAVHVSGNQHITVLDNIHDARMAWHPTEDLLFVAGVTNNTDYDDLTVSDQQAYIRMTLINPSEDAAISSFEMLRTATSQSYQGAIPYIQWLDDEHALAFFDQPTETSRQQDDTNFFVFNTDGTIDEKTLPRIARVEQGFFPSVSPTGYVMYQRSDETTIIIEHLITGQQWVFSDERLIVKRIAWDIDGQSATVTGNDRTCEPVYSCDDIVRYFSLANGVSEIAVSTSHETATPLNELETMATHLCQEQRTSFVALPLGYDRDTSSQPVAFYNCIQNMIVSTFNIDTYAHKMFVSPDANTITYIHSNIGIFDVATQTHRRLQPDSRGYNSSEYGEIIWHSSSDWFITAENATVASGGSPFSWVGVVSVDGSINRDLAFCIPREPCIGWLPDRVDRSSLSEGQPHSVVPEPDRVIHLTDWTFYLSWSPDGQRMVSAMEYFGEGSRDSFLLDVQSGETIGTLFGIDYQQEIDWIQSADGMYTPTILPRNDNRPQIGRWTWAVSPDEQYAVVELDDRSGVVVYDIEAEIQLFELGHTGYPLAVFSPDNRYVIFSGVYQPFQIWDIATGEIVVELNTNATALAFSPDGQTLALASSWDIQLWNLEILLPQPDS